MFILFMGMFTLTIVAGFVIAYSIKKYLLVTHPDYKGEKIKFFSRKNWRLPKIFKKRKMAEIKKYFSIDLSP